MLPPWRFLVSRWPWLGLLHVIGDFVLFLVTLPIVVLTLIALPLWAILLAAIERRRFRLLGAPNLASGHVRVPRDERHNWLNIRLLEPATWRESAALLIGLIFGALSFAVLLAQAVCAALPVALAITGSQRPSGAQVTLFFEVEYTVTTANWWHPLLVLPLVLAVFGYLNAAFAALHASVIGWFLAPRTGEIDKRVERLTRSRAAILDAHGSERRRIERDLHDGVQQELVGIAARLGILELELSAGDTRAARDALRTAQDQTERALSALRETVRGIHPAVLTDHGLASALEELSGRSALPLRIVDEGMPRLSPAAEAAGYFLVAEAVTNAAKHTVASRLDVRLGVADGRAFISASDDGHGGADPERGSGLTGLAGRAEALGGTMVMTSPPGGPTVLCMTLPIGAERAGVIVEDRRGVDADPARG